MYLIYGCFEFYSVVSRDVIVIMFLLVISSSGRLAEIKWSVCISESQRNLCVLFFRTDSELCVYHLFVWSNFNFFLQFLVDHLAQPVVLSYILSVVVCCIRLSCDWLLRRYHHITYICSFFQIQDKNVCLSQSANTLRKCMILIINPQAMSKW